MNETADLVLLGTGAADGWPNPFCRCDSCSLERAAGRVRAQSAALVDGHILVDCGPGTPEAAERLGVDLTGVDTIVYTHAHSDHFSPAVLMHRSWVSDAPLTVVGPPDVVEQARAWLSPQAPVAWQPLMPGETWQTSGVRLQALSSTHRTHLAGDEPDSLLYLIETPRGRHLYACDTGTLPENSVAALAHTALDSVVMEQTFGDRADLAGSGHHTIAGVVRDVTRLRRNGAITGSTRVAVTHLSHHNPPLPELESRLAPHGIEVAHDGWSITKR